MQIILDTLPHRFEPDGFARRAGQHHNRQRRRRGACPQKRLPPRAVGQRQIQQHHVMGPLAQLCQPLRQRLHVGELKLAGFVHAQRLLQ